MEPKFEVGDIVRVNVQKMDKYRFYYHPNEMMFSLAGKNQNLKIKSYNREKRRAYEVIGSSWLWDERWLEKVEVIEATEL